MPPLIQLENVSKSYQTMQDAKKKIFVLENIHLTIEEGDFICIIGKSGEGKSTLLHLMAGLDTPDTGKISWIGKDITDATEKERTLLRKNHIGLLFQHHGLLRDFTVIENIALAKNICGTNWTQSKKIAEHWLEQFNLLERKHHYPFELSGGEKQRTALIRALIGEPRLLLADEPTGNLDPYNTQIILSAIQNIWKKKQITVVLVTHNQFVREACQKTYQIQKRQIQAL